MKLKMFVCCTLLAIIGCDSGSSFTSSSSSRQVERYKGNGFSIEKILDATMNTREDYVSFIVCNEDKTRVGSVDAGRKWTETAGDIEQIEVGYNEQLRRGEISELSVQKDLIAKCCAVTYSAQAGGMKTRQYMIVKVCSDNHSFVYARAAAPDYCWDSVKDILLRCAKSVRPE